MEGVQGLVQGTAITQRQGLAQGNIADDDDDVSPLVIFTQSRGGITNRQTNYYEKKFISIDNYYENQCKPCLVAIIPMFHTHSEEFQLFIVGTHNRYDYLSSMSLYYSDNGDRKNQESRVY